jgi:hypothetical protein
MPALSTLAVSPLVKMIVIGNSGVGKTGALAELAKAGYRLFIYDFDMGTDILLDPTILPPSHRDNIFVKSFRDKATVQGGNMIPQATAWKEFMKALSEWTEGTEKMGSFRTWSDNDVLVIDSMTFMSDAAFSEVLGLNSRLSSRPQIQDYGAAMENIQAVFELLYSDHCKCHVIFTSHLQFGDDEQSMSRKGQVSVLGKKLAPKIPRYVNNMVLIEKQVIGNTVKRKLRTVGTPFVDLKVSKPGKVPAEMEPNLAQLFKLLRE